MRQGKRAALSSCVVQKRLLEHVINVSEPSTRRNQLQTFPSTTVSLSLRADGVFQRQVKQQLAATFCAHNRRKRTPTARVTDISLSTHSDVPPSPRPVWCRLNSGATIADVLPQQILNRAVHRSDRRGRRAACAVAGGPTAPFDIRRPAAGPCVPVGHDGPPSVRPRGRGRPPARDRRARYPGGGAPSPRAPLLPPARAAHPRPRRLCHLRRRRPWAHAAAAAGTVVAWTGGGAGGDHRLLHHGGRVGGRLPRWGTPVGPGCSLWSWSPWPRRTLVPSRGRSAAALAAGSGGRGAADGGGGVS